MRYKSNDYFKIKDTNTIVISYILKETEYNPGQYEFRDVITLDGTPLDQGWLWSFDENNTDIKIIEYLGNFRSPQEFQKNYPEYYL